jgi:hypothetical protein
MHTYCKLCILLFPLKKANPTSFSIQLDTGYFDKQQRQAVKEMSVANAPQSRCTTVHKHTYIV